MTRLSGEGVLESDVSGGGLEWVGGMKGVNTRLLEGCLHCLQPLEACPFVFLSLY